MLNWHLASLQDLTMLICIFKVKTPGNEVFKSLYKMENFSRLTIYGFNRLFSSLKNSNANSQPFATFNSIASRLNPPGAFRPMTNVGMCCNSLIWLLAWTGEWNFYWSWVQQLMCCLSSAGLRVNLRVPVWESLQGSIIQLFKFFWRNVIK